jgi:hypothetical protein
MVGISVPLAHVDPQSGDHVDLLATEIDPPLHPGSQQLVRYWDRCRELPGGLTIGRDLPTRTILKILDKLYLLDPIAGATDFRFRLAPSGLIRRFGTDVSGHLLSELYSGRAFEQYAQGLRQTLEFERPVSYDVRVIGAAKDVMHLERVSVPVKSRDLSRTLLLGGTFYF